MDTLLTILALSAIWFAFRAWRIGTSEDYCLVIDEDEKD